MSTVDEILANPIEHLDLPDGSIPTHVIVLVEYAEPGSDNYPGRQRLATVADEDLPPWTSVGMLRYAIQFDLVLVKDDDD